MKATKIIYSRVFSMDGYENKKVGIEVELEKGDSVDHAYQYAVDFVESKNPEIIKLNSQAVKKEEYDKMKEEFERMIRLPEEYTEQQVIEAIRFIRNDRSEDLPF